MLSATLACQSHFAAAHEVRITYTLTNESDEVLYVCQYYTPLEGIKNSHIVEVTNDTIGQQLRYAGVMCKRLPPKPEQYWRIEPRGQLSNDFDLNRACQLVSGATYTVSAGDKIKTLRVRSVQDDPSTERSVPVTNTTTCTFSIA